jgi:hypothetical protein
MGDGTGRVFLIKTQVISLLKTAWLPVTICWLGAGLNALVVRVNGGMPALGLNAPYGKWVPLTSQTHLPFLGDIIPILDYQASLGDVLMWIGIASWLYIAVRNIFQIIREVKQRGFSWY